MEARILILTLIVWAGNFSLHAQTKTPAEYEAEIAHLREQVVSVIKDADGSHKESDAEIMRLAQRVRNLEQENHTLRTKSVDQMEFERKERVKVTEKMLDVEKERARLDSENTLLRQQVASLEGEIRAGRIQMQRKEADIKKELLARTQQIEAQLNATKTSQAATQKEADKLRRTAQMNSVQAAELEHERNNLNKELSHLAEGKIEERETLQSALAEAESKLQSKKVAQMEYRQRIDSLKYELDGMNRVVSVLTHMDKIERKRLARVEELERELASAEVSMRAERILLEQRGKELMRREAALSVKQQRFGEIRSREAALKMLEARLRNQASLSPSK